MSEPNVTVLKQYVNAAERVFSALEEIHNLGYDPLGILKQHPVNTNGTHVEAEADPMPIQTHDSHEVLTARQSKTTPTFGGAKPTRSRNGFSSMGPNPTFSRATIESGVRAVEKHFHNGKLRAIFKAYIDMWGGGKWNPHSDAWRNEVAEELGLTSGNVLAEIDNWLIWKGYMRKDRVREYQGGVSIWMDPKLRIEDMLDAAALARR